jgi:imidazole glycerol-phosphate synthase subunit HisF
LYKRIISRLDIKNGILVKGIQLEGLRNLGDPSYFAGQYYNDQIDEICFQDVVATLYNKNLISKIIEKCSENIFVNIAVGGGIRKIEDVDTLLRIGVDKICVNSEAVRDNNFLKKLVTKYGSSTIAVNIDTIFNGNFYEVLIETGREKTNLRLESWVEKLNILNVGEIVLTEISREGTQKGFNIDLYKKILKLTNIPIIANGGAGNNEQILELFQATNVSGVSIATMLHYDYMKENDETQMTGTNYFLKNKKKGETKNKIKDLKKFLLKNNINVRF